MYSVVLISCTYMCGVSTSVLLVTIPLAQCNKWPISNIKTPEHHFSLTTLDNTVCTVSHLLCSPTVGAKKKFPYSTVLLPYLTVLLPFFNRTYALLPTYFRRTLIVLLPHPLTYFNRTTSVLSPYRDTTIIDW